MGDHGTYGNTLCRPLPSQKYHERNNDAAARPCFCFLFSCVTWFRQNVVDFLMAEQRSMQRSMWNRFKARAVWFRASFNHVNMFQQFSTYFNLLFVVLISPFATKVKAMTLKLANSCPGWKNPSPRLPQLNSWGHWMILVYIIIYLNEI